MELLAIKNYAMGLGKDITSVTLEEVASSTHGVAHYANIGLDLSARGAIGQSCKTRVAGTPWESILDDLLPDIKKEFRTVWNVSAMALHATPATLHQHRPYVSLGHFYFFLSRRTHI